MLEVETELIIAERLGEEVDALEIELSYEMIEERESWDER